MEYVCSFSSVLNSGVKCGGEIVVVEEFSDEQKELMFMRTRDKPNKVENLCVSHKNYFLEKYEFFHKGKCCNPFQKHKKTIKKGKLVTLSLKKCQENILLTELAPGKQICTNCAVMLDHRTKGEIETSVDDQPGSSNSENQLRDEDEELYFHNSGEALSSILSELNSSVSPLKLHGLSEKSKKAYKKVWRLVSHFVIYLLLLFFLT